MPFIGGVLNCLLPIENIRKPILELTGATLGTQHILQVDVRL